jgi:large subunit ribosomal protein L30
MAVKTQPSKKKSSPRPERRTAPASSGKMLKIKLVRSLAGNPVSQRLVVKGLGLRKVNSEVVRPDRPEVRGMVRKVAHLVRVDVVESK